MRKVDETKKQQTQQQQRQKIPNQRPQNRKDQMNCADRLRPFNLLTFNMHFCTAYYMHIFVLRKSRIDTGYKEDDVDGDEEDMLYLQSNTKKKTRCGTYEYRAISDLRTH